MVQEMACDGEALCNIHVYLLHIIVDIKYYKKRHNMSWYVMFVKTGYEEDVCSSIDKTALSSFEEINYNFLLPKSNL